MMAEVRTQEKGTWFWVGHPHSCWSAGRTESPWPVVRNLGNILSHGEESPHHQISPYPESHFPLPVQYSLQIRHSPLFIHDIPENGDAVLPCTIFEGHSSFENR